MALLADLRGPLFIGRVAAGNFTPGHPTLFRSCWSTWRVNVANSPLPRRQEPLDVCAQPAVRVWSIVDLKAPSVSPQRLISRNFYLLLPVPANDQIDARTTSWCTPMMRAGFR